MRNGSILAARLVGWPPSKFGVVTDALFVGWIGGGILTAVQFLYILTGREVLDLSSSGMVVRVVMGPWNKSLHYALDDICNLRYIKFRVCEIPDGNQFSLLLPLQIGRIGFDSAGRIVRFGAGLSEPEAQDLIDRLSVRLHSAPEANEDNRFRS